MNMNRCVFVIGSSWTSILFLKVIHLEQIYFSLPAPSNFGIIEPILVDLKTEYRLSRCWGGEGRGGEGRGGVCSLANYIAAYEET